MDLEDNLRNLENELRELTEGATHAFYRRHHRYSLAGCYLVNKCLFIREEKEKEGTKVSRCQKYNFLLQKHASYEKKRKRTYAEIVRE